MPASDIKSDKDVRIRVLRRRQEAASAYTRDALRDLEDVLARTATRAADFDARTEKLQEQGAELQRQWEAANAAGALTPQQTASLRTQLRKGERMLRKIRLQQERREMRHREILRLQRRIEATMANGSQSLADLEQLRAYELDRWSWKSRRGIFNNLALGAIVWMFFTALFRR